jgi:hypothetical protein
MIKDILLVVGGIAIGVVGLWLYQWYNFSKYWDHLNGRV